MIRKTDQKLPLDPPGPARQDQDPVCRADGLGEIVRDQDRRLFPAADDRADIITDGESCLIIKSRKRLIEQQNIRLQRQCPNQRRPLPHAAGKLGRPCVIKILKPIRIKKLSQPPDMPGITLPLNLKPERSI